MKYRAESYFILWTRELLQKLLGKFVFHSSSSVIFEHRNMSIYLFIRRQQHNHLLLPGVTRRPAVSMLLPASLVTQPALSWDVGGWRSNINKRAKFECRWEETCTKI